MATTQSGTSGTTAGARTQQGMMGGTSDTAYNLISVLYHTLQGCQTYEKYAQDAEQAGEQHIAQFFRETGREFERCAQRGQQLLAQCLQQAQSTPGGRGTQLSSQMGTSSGQQSQSGMSSGQQGATTSSSHGQQGGFEDRTSSLGSSGTTHMGSSDRSGR